MGAHQDGQAALYIASRNGHPKVVKLLLDNGANVTIAVKDSFMPLHAASFNGHLAVVKLLLENKAYVRVNKDVWAPLYAASQQGTLCGG
jgi:ankyrin repeat protein